MRTFSKCLFITLLMIGVGALAAEPSTIAELKKHFESVASERESLICDYSMTMDMASAAGAQAGALGMGETEMKGTMTVKGEQMRMDMDMDMSMTIGDQSMDMDISMVMVMGDDKVMNMLTNMNIQGIPQVQAMKMDMKIMESLAEEMGVPASSLNSGNMGMGGMTNPAKMLDVYGDMYDLTLKGKETLNGEEVYVIETVLNEETLENFKSSPMLAAQAEMLSKPSNLYLGAKDGVMRKMTAGFMTMEWSNIKFDAEIPEDAFTLDIPEGVMVMDMTEMMKGAFATQ